MVFYDEVLLTVFVHVPADQNNCMIYLSLLAFHFGLPFSMVVIDDTIVVELENRRRGTYFRDARCL